MLVQENPGDAASNCCPSRTEDSVEAGEATEGNTDAPDKVKLQTDCVSVDIRHKTQADRAKRVNFLRLQLSSMKNDGSKKTEAKKKSLMYSIKILDK